MAETVKENSMMHVKIEGIALTVHRQQHFFCNSQKHNENCQRNFKPAVAQLPANIMHPAHVPSFFMLNVLKHYGGIYHFGKSCYNFYQTNRHQAKKPKNMIVIGCIG